MRLRLCLHQQCSVTPALAALDEARLANPSKELVAAAKKLAIESGVPTAPLFELYDLRVTADGGIDDTARDAVILPGCGRAQPNRSRTPSPSGPRWANRATRARNASRSIGWALSSGDAELGTAACATRASACDAFELAATEMIQMHGGVGFTWEYDVHLYFKRAKASATLLGDAPYHRERVAQGMGLDDA